MRIRYAKSAVGLAALTASLAIVTGLAGAAEPDKPAVPGASAAGRFAMNPVDGGFLRMDTDTGTVSHCTKKGTGWACETVPDDYKALQQENEALKRELSQLRKEARTGGNQDAKSDRKFELPSEEEVDKALGQIDKYMRKFKGWIEKHQGQGQETPGRT